MRELPGVNGWRLPSPTIQYNNGSSLESHSVLAVLKRSRLEPEWSSIGRRLMQLQVTAESIRNEAPAKSHGAFIA